MKRENEGDAVKIEANKELQKFVSKKKRKIKIVRKIKMH